MRTKLIVLAGALMLGPAAYAVVPAVAHQPRDPSHQPRDPDGDDDLVCPRGQTNPAYCSEDERGPDVDVSPHHAKVSKTGKLTLTFRCTGHASGNCFGRATITANKKTHPDHGHSQDRTIILAQRNFTIPENRNTNVDFQISSEGLALLRSKENVSAKVNIVARQADSDPQTSKETVILSLSGHEGEHGRSDRHR
jgi:hypothetical protein